MTNEAAEMAVATVSPNLRVLVEYDSNNSGGGWWLGDEEWLALERAGWTVHWGGRQEKDRCASLTEVDKWGKRWLDGAAMTAEKEFGSPREALQEFERVTGQTVSDEGCNCCGPPHSFSWKWVDSDLEGGYCSGEDCVEVLLGVVDVPSRRELAERVYGRGEGDDQ